MKKISIFLAALLFFTATAVTPGNVQEVQAYSKNEIDKYDFNNYYSAKAGSKVSIPTISCGVDEDLTGMKVAYCLSDNHSLEAAVAVWDITNEDKHIYNYASGSSDASICKNVTFESDMPEGRYDVVFFDAAGNVKKVFTKYDLINKSLVKKCNFTTINNDGYVYAYVYEEDVPVGISVDESYCPVLYDADQQTALTAYDDFTIYKEDGSERNIYFYRLKVLDGENSRIWDDSSHNNNVDYGALFKYMNSEAVPAYMNQNEMGWASILYKNKWSAAKNPFEMENTQTPDNTPSNNPAGSASLTGKSKFIALLYENVLERSATEDEIANWVQELENGKSGADTAFGFIFSEEFTNKNLSNSEYVERLYQSMMGRASDEGGKSNWVTHLENGVSRLYVFKQFVNSQEFTNLCEEYAIVRGDVELSEARDMNYNVTRFVARNYREFLGRDYDEAGLNDWTSRINHREQTMQEIAAGFVFSQECTNKNLSDEAYVQMLYRGCFDRIGDEAGVTDWVSKLAAGSYDREAVFWGFANSQEFANMVSSYGL